MIPETHSLGSRLGLPRGRFRQSLQSAPSARASGFQEAGFADRSKGLKDGAIDIDAFPCLRWGLCGEREADQEAASVTPPQMRPHRCSVHR